MEPSDAHYPYACDAIMGLIGKVNSPSLLSKAEKKLCAWCFKNC
ncbi:hypothetical protein OOU_Y34scaffold00268g4 [Pyricularia oryzae Y34]|uniref:Uncharacterized protein n=1 Tax=Pyricularia oryzae (strain Y34) TaxID=1143189 RepID=A0AA97P4I7_PYRO3|nr:uncharacterized protein PpBr36_11325 [Pyricularia pennisetigena]ELQ41562.1 hypothetical protein OOU_Y34scaffold00268g4 [Pyricularia oryzae Y34]TLS20318.1 hypothetical protein PpBr36_11325 [Pyricularia pennisetigena]